MLEVVLALAAAVGALGTMVGVGVGLLRFGSMHGSAMTELTLIRDEVERVGADVKKVGEQLHQRVSDLDIKNDQAHRAITSAAAEAKTEFHARLSVIEKHSVEAANNGPRKG